MRNIKVGLRVARQVRAAEQAVDQAMIEVCKLIQMSLEGRGEASLAAEVGQSEGKIKSVAPFDLLQLAA